MLAAKGESGDGEGADCRVGACMGAFCCFVGRFAGGSIVLKEGQTFRLDPPFFVLATQNPLEQEGTYPLPEAQLDRFMFSIHVDYPSEEEEEIIARFTTSDSSVTLNKIMGAAEVLELQALCLCNILRLYSAVFCGLFQTAFPIVVC